MGNHVIYDRIWVSKKLSRCSREAALAYPTIFLVCDEWGRFEYRPHMIYNAVFGPRLDYSPTDVYTVEDVAGWLAEYEREMLLIRYHLDGDLAVWTKFQGRPPAKRRKSTLPDPRQFPEYVQRLAVMVEQERKPSGIVTGRPTEGSGKADGRAKEATYVRLEQEQEQEQETRATAAAVAETPAQPVDPGPVEPKCPRCQRNLQRETGRYADTSTKGKGWVCLRRDGGCGAVFARSDPMVVQQLSERARGALFREIEAEETAHNAPKTPATDPTQDPGAMALYARKGELASEFLAWFTLNPEAGRLHGHEGLLGQAITGWAKDKHLPGWVRSAVLEHATELHRKGNGQ